MWSYYGSKANIAHRYPKPQYDKIYEPFAGTAKYSLLHFEKEVILIDKYPVVINLWKFLQSCSPNDILKLNLNLKAGERIDTLKWDCEEQMILMVFIIGAGQAAPLKTASARRTTQRPNTIKYNLERIAGDLYKIKHWEFILGDYFEAPDVPATWFIDPPYQFGGHKYVKSNKKIDFISLGDWSQSRQGQSIVCENNLATWLNFKPMISQRGSEKQQYECILTNTPTHFDNVQQILML